MKSKAKNLLVKLTSLVLAVFLVLPSQVWAADLLKKDSRKYTANSSIMGLATQTSPDDRAESLAEEADRQTLLKANQATDQTDAYIIEKSATLSKTTKEITYQFIIKSKTPSIESEKKENIYAIFALNNNTDLTDIKVDKVTTLDESGKEIKATYQASNPGIFANDTNISTLGIRSEKQANDLLYYLSAKVDDEAIAKIEKGDYSPIFALDMVLANNDKKAIYENRYALEVNKYTEEAKSDERLLEIKEEEKLEEVEESKSLIKGEYSPESNGLFATNPATITWTDYILSTDDKEFAYDIDLNKAQETENSEISVEFYEAKENGFILNNSFSQKLPFASSIKLQIPKGQLARITLTTTINKEANAKEFTYNGKILANPDHKEDQAREESKTEEKANDDPDPLPEQKEESQDKSKDKEKAESDKTEITLEADPETNEVIVDPDLIKDEKADKNEEEYSAIDLNRDSVIRKFQEEENADPIMEIAINNIASLFSDYNKEAISYDKLLASLKEQSKDIDKEDFRTIATALLAGINKDNYKIANIEIDTLLEDIYGKETITEVIEDEKAVEDSSIENNSDDDIPTQTIDQNLDLDSLDTENEADSLSPEEKDKQKALESFDKALDQVKEESKKPQDDDRTLFGNISEGVKGIFGKSNLQKADSELKAALEEGKSLEEIQALLLDLGEKYELNRKDEARLMADNEDAIKALIKRDADQNFRPNILMGDDISPLNDKKFTIRTRFDTSTATGPIEAGQYFNIHLDDKLTVKNPSSLKNITYKRRVIAEPIYDSEHNTIKYKIVNDINDDISIPVNVDVDYDTAKTPKDKSFTVINSISGLGVVDPKALAAEQIDKNGNPAGTILEEGRDDVVQIVGEDDRNYKMNMDIVGHPAVAGMDMTGINWTLRVDSTVDLKELGYKLNLTTVEGSGLGEIQDVKINGKSVDLTDQIDGKLGISDSKHHALNESAKTLVYTFNTPVTNKQASYMIDVSTILTAQNKVGALRHIINEGYPQDKIEENSPNRTSMNNRTTIKGEFKSEDKAEWTITDAVSTGDTNNGLPLETRTPQNQDFDSGNRAVYSINEGTGMMEVKNPESTISSLPAKETDPKGKQAVGNIAVYKFRTSLNTPDKPTDYSVGGVTISKYKDITVDQNWSLAEGYEKMPSQKLTVTDDNNRELGKIDPDLLEETGHQRTVTIPDVRFWQIANDGKASMIDHKVVQTLPTDIINVKGQDYKFKEIANYYDVNSKTHYITNALVEYNDQTPATFTVVKVDSKDPQKRLKGAKFYLLGAEIGITTNDKGEATFNNIKPGTYYLKETKAPTGYKLDQEEKIITISNKGEVSVSGKNAQFSSGSGKTDILEHSDYDKWKDFMNTQHYGKVDENGDLKFYVYLKPYDQRVGGRTDKDTTFNISIPGVDLKDSNIKVYDVNPNQRPDIFASMNNQNVDQKLSSLGQITLGAPNNNGAIEGQENVQNPLSGNTGYQISFPQGRFGDNWGFLVEVNANIEDKDSTVLSYDWLAKEGPANQSKIRANVNLSKNSDENGHPTITISNEEFAKSPIEVAKFADTSTDGNKDRLGGAEFVLKNENGLVLANKVTNKDGKVSFGEYPTGKYYLEEVKAPDGYEKSNVYFKVTVDEKGQVSYDARFKNSSGTPTVGVDYYIERESDGQSEDKAVVTYVNQKMEINDDEGRGNFRGIWEAYRLESLKYHLDAKINNAAPGSRFEIQFDPNLDFTQYFKTFPNLEFKGKMIAKPYFNYKTNLLTYVFNENSLSNGETTFSIDLKGMIPSKFYATHSGEWKFTNVVAPHQNSDIKGNPVENITVHADYDGYDQHTTKGLFPSQTYYFRDVYKADDGNWYVTAIGYYNPLGDYKTGNANKIWFNWKFAAWQGNKYETWSGQFDPPYYLKDVKIYETTIPPLKKYEAHKDYSPAVNDYMPLSMGVRPEEDPSTYERVYHAEIDHEKPYNRSEGGFNLSYDPSKVTSGGALYERENPPLTISVPKISPTKDAYLIEQTFRIRDINEFNTHWRAFYMANGEEKSGNRGKSLNSFFVTGPNDNIAKADQTGIELPTYARELVGIINRRYTPGSFKLTKVNQANHNQKLKGATFVLIDEEGNKLYRTSDDNGEISFDNLAPGKYTLKEYRAPVNYEKTKEEWNVTVYSDGNVKITSTSITGASQEYTGKDTINIEVTNKPGGQDFMIYKKDNEGKRLAGAEFTLKKQVKDGETAPKPREAITDPNGVATFKNLDDGTYIIEESEAPDGYKDIDKKWVLVIDSGTKKIYTYSKSSTKEIKSILGADGTNWVNVKERPTTGWSNFDNRWTGWAANSNEARYLGTRIVAINNAQNYVIQRYVINPEARSIGQTTAIIHREKPNYQNMDWYSGEDYKVFTLDSKEGGNTDVKVTGLISDLRLADYNETDITSSITKALDKSHFGETRLKLSLPATDKPIVIDVKIPYHHDYEGVGTGMDWYEGYQNYWKSDYYERVSDIQVGDPTKREEGSIIGSYISEGSLDVENELKTYGFKIKKVRYADKTKAIQGAVFKLTGPDPSTDERYMTSGTDGMIAFDNLKPGIYKLEETEPAPGYQKPDTDWQVTITRDGKAYIKANNPNAETTSTLVKYVKSISKLKTNANKANDGLEIGDNLVGNPLRAGTGVTYDILGTISDAEKKSVKVSTSAKYLGNDEFLVRIDVIGNENVNKKDVTFDLQLHDDVTFVPNSTITWKENANDKDQVPNNPSRWHSGYDSSTKKIGVRDGAISIDKGDTASMEFKVKMKPDLRIGQTGNIVNSFKVYNIDCDKLKAKKMEAYTIYQNAQNGTIITDPLNYQRNGQPVTFTAIPNQGYKLVGNVTVTNNNTKRDVSIKNGNEFLMPASDVTINAKFEANTYKVKKGKIENGSIILPSTSAKTDEEVSFTLDPEDGYKIGEVTITDDSGQKVKFEIDDAGNGKFTMPASDVTINATFIKKAYKITKQNPTNGDFTVPETAEAGSKVTITLVPAPGYEKDTISVRGGQGPIQVTGNTFIMPKSDVVVEVTFKPIPPKEFTITVNNATNGSVSSNKQSAKENEEVTLTVNADEDYELDKLYVNGDPVEVTNGTYTLNMPNKAVTVSATFKEKPITPPEGSTLIPEDGFATITNKQTGLELKILKRDNNDRILEKAEFKLEKYIDGSYERKDTEFQDFHGTSDENGNVILKDNEDKPVSLPVGYYKLTETKAPLGYNAPQAPFEIEVYEEAGQLKAKYKGPKYNDYQYIKANESYDNQSVQEVNGIKYKSKLININTESKTYVQRIYIDTRGYNGSSDKINIQINPKHKREETDNGPGKEPNIDVEGVKTAYRSTYKITGAPNDDNFADTVLNNYDLSRNDVTMLNTARWRPFDWGFDEDIMNLDKGGVYYIDVEGFYDDAILTGKDNHQGGKETITNPEDLQKLEINFDFYDGAREFQQAVGRYSQGNIKFEKVKKGSYQAGNLALGLTKFEKSPDGQLGKTGGRINPPLNDNEKTSIQTSIDLNTLYSSDQVTVVPQEGMTVVNEEEKYNVTFSKHGRDNPKDEIDSEAVTTNRLEGAIFKLEKEIANTFVDVEGSYVGSAFNGYFGFRGLEPGRYRLKEVKAPEGYKPITDPLLYFTIKTVKVNTGEVVDPESGDIVDIKTVNVRFESKGTTYNLSELQMVDPKDSNNKLNIKDVDSKDIDIETSKIVNPDTGNEVLLKDMIVVGEEQFKEDGSSYYKEYPVKDIKIVPGSSGYISLEYNEANGVYQYLPENKKSAKDGKLIDFVTSATAKNMGKIINEKPGQGKVKITKVAQVGNEIKANELLPGAKFRLTRLTEKEGEEERDLIKTRTVGEDGTLTFDELPIGNYRLEEIESPEGYINTNQVWHFTVGGEGLDPYAGPIENNGRNLSDKITLQTIKASVLNPDTKTSTDITPQYNEIHPHWGESIEFTNKFELAKGIKINPGDYFTLKMSNQIDLNGIFEKRIDNLDIIAPGVGTIAKADYDRENRIITYTFTEYANTYTLVNFSNKLTAFIDLYEVKQSYGKSDKQNVGFGISVPKQPEDKSQYKDIKVVYDLDFGEETDHLGNSINLVSKIVKYNPETGEFLHYYYVNRKQENTAGPVEFRYVSDQELENLNVSVSYVTNYGNVEEEMPESFGVDENSSNLTPFDTVNSLRQLEKGDYTRVKFDDGIHNTHNYIIKVTGRVAEEDKTEYTAHGTLYKFNNCYYPTYAERHDAIRYFVNQATADVVLEITAVNPENIIVYKKVDQSGKAVPGAKFTLKYKAKEEDEYLDTGIDEKSGEDGLVTFKKLKPGFYQLVETLAPTGYLKLDGPVEEFKVDKYGKIIRKETIPNPVGGSEQKEVEEYGVEPIYITNKKEHEIKFKKVDAESKTALEGAEFEVWYKAKKDGIYTDDRKLYQNEAGDKLVLMADEKAPEGYTETKVFKSGDDGLVKFKFYEPGYYALKETKAPDGYMTPTEPVYEFRLENGKVQVLKNNVDKVTTNDGYLESQVLKVDKENKTFRQRIIIYPIGTVTKQNTYLSIVQNGWTMDKDGQINVVKLPSGSDINNTLPEKFTPYSPTITKSNEFRYYLKDFYKTNTNPDLTISQPIVVEFTGTIDEEETRPDITTDLIFKDTKGLKEDNITFMIDTEKDKSQQSAYTDKYNTSIEIKNKKSTFPLTGGNGVFAGFAIIGTAVMLAAIAYFGIFHNDKNRRRSARYKK